VPITVTDIDTLQDYFSELVKNARHHGPTVQEVLLILAGAVILYKDKGHPLQVHGVAGGDMHNEAWIHIRGTRYALAYDHNQGAVRIKRDSQKGPVVASFDNTDTVADVLKKFDAL